MIDVCRDAEGLRLALEELFEEDFARGRIRRNVQNADEQTAARMEATIPPLKLSPGYHRLANHILALDAEHRAGVPLDPRFLASFEARGLIALGDARAAFGSRHPECTACGSRQDTKFEQKCWNCGAKFRRKGA